MNNIDTFNTIVGLSLAELYEEFPTPKEIDAWSYADKAGVNLEHIDVFQKEKIFPAVATLKWLSDEGYIRCGNLPKNLSDRFSQTVLTSKGLQLLSLPESIERQNSIGSQMASAVKAGANDVLKDLAKTAICEGAKLIFRTGIELAMRP